MAELYPDTEPTKAGVVKSFTRDSSVQACIFDLIDNAIDAWHTGRLADPDATKSEHGVLTDFSGLEIEVIINARMVSVADNGPGMTSATIEEGALKFGAPSVKSSGIGLFGVGLNRTIFKIGGVGLVDSRTLGEECLVELDVAKYVEDQDHWTISATSHKYDGPTGTRVEITQPNEHAIRFLSRKSKVDRLAEVAAEVYAYFLDRGLLLSINGDVLTAKFIHVRADSPFPKIEDSDTLTNGAKILIKAGQHSDHRFSAEPKKKGHSNKGLTREYGWSVYCNDRAIALRNKEEKTGWDHVWHNEYNGFVGSVFFYSEDTEELPFNTSKTDLVLTHETYEIALDMMQDAVRKWVSFANIADSYRREGKTLENKTVTDDILAKERRNQQQKQFEKPEKPKRPPKDWMVLPPDIDVSRCQPKLRTLVFEAQTTPINKKRYTSLALMRMLFEIAAQDYLIEIKQLKVLKKAIIAARNKDRIAAGRPKMTPQERRELEPKLSDILGYLLKTRGIFGENIGTHLDRSVQDFAGHKGRMDSAIHNPRHKIGVPNVEEIRDEILPILKHLIERPDDVDLDESDADER
ncbi:ATP-binding protein [Eilatimonas milleporae]|uniref:Histidine kinase/DNA gyrase B/HSP90-like ATPase n=1 Tax=Eilatimonas milleporae TaxID=911205 RepID=A0A3M0CE60_9PROT|nr:ATP-binding protein [Eilatimonas milleporae]RMB08104.1 histidine kinase/DNA gyrase B/HSP90-like ATPase [Eilatimonas milleporae]